MNKKIVDVHTENMQIIDDVSYLQGQLQSAKHSLITYDPIKHAKAIENANHNIEVYKRLLRIKDIRFNKNIELMHKMARS